MLCAIGVQELFDREVGPLVEEGANQGQIFIRYPMSLPTGMGRRFHCGERSVPSDQPVDGCDSHLEGAGDLLPSPFALLPRSYDALPQVDR